MQAAVQQAHVEEGRAVVRTLQNGHVAVRGQPRARLEAPTSDQQGAAYCKVTP